MQTSGSLVFPCGVMFASAAARNGLADHEAIAAAKAGVFRLTMSLVATFSGGSRPSGHADDIEDRIERGRGQSFARNACAGERLTAACGDRLDYLSGLRRVGIGYSAVSRQVEIGPGSRSFVPFCEGSKALAFWDIIRFAC